MPLRKKNEPGDETEEKDVQATEGGFGTGLRAQLEKRRGEQVEEAAPARAGTAGRDAVRSGRPLHVGTAPDQRRRAERGGSRSCASQLAEAQKRERELRAAFAEQVEAYERKMSEEYDVSREQTKLARPKRQAFVAPRARSESASSDSPSERQELNAERQQLSAIQDEVAAAQSAAAELQEELQARDAELTEAERFTGRSSSELAQRGSAVAAREEKLDKDGARPRDPRGSVEGARERAQAPREGSRRARSHASPTPSSASRRKAHAVSAESEALKRREAEVHERHGRIRTETQQLERQLTSSGAEVQQMHARLAEIEAARRS